MRKIFIALLISALSFTARAEMPAKARAMVTMIGYGTAGGAILGAASMAFGTTSRAVFQGASLGLYAGILFGTYVLVSHHNKRAGSYDDDSSPYKESSDIYGEGYNSEDGGSSDDSEASKGGFFDRFKVMQEKFHGQAFTLHSDRQKGSKMPPIQLNLLQYNF